MEDSHIKRCKLKKTSVDQEMNLMKFSVKNQKTADIDAESKNNKSFK